MKVPPTTNLLYSSALKKPSSAHHQPLPHTQPQPSLVPDIPVSDSPATPGSNHLSQNAQLNPDLVETLVTRIENDLIETIVTRIENALEKTLDRLLTKFFAQVPQPTPEADPTDPPSTATDTDIRPNKATNAGHTLFDQMMEKLLITSLVRLTKTTPQADVPQTPTTSTKSRTQPPSTSRYPTRTTIGAPKNTDTSTTQTS
ncbi:salivary glue protein Sgs-3-like [Procambarus clarkii]|uniref:salivary glue protein Sgs-3-like n=1 Tax=Procambarus clarkii TaxID=6728 RepID=UPI003744874C